jgi:hypothetical protein
MATPDDVLWDELSALTSGLERLRREIARCVGRSPHKDDLQRHYANMETRREEILEQLRQSAGQVG